MHSVVRNQQLCARTTTTTITTTPITTTTLDYPQRVFVCQSEASKSSADQIEDVREYEPLDCGVFVPARPTALAVFV